MKAQHADVDGQVRRGAGDGVGPERNAGGEHGFTAPVVLGDRAPQSHVELVEKTTGGVARR